MTKCLIIAEAGVNHNGSIETAKKLIEAAAAAGADIVKFQTFKADALVTKSAAKASYQKTNSTGPDSQHDMLRRLELSESDHYLLMEHAALFGIRFFSTGFDAESLRFLGKLGLKLFKVPSGEITNTPYLRLISELADEVILSTGMTDLSEIEWAINILEKSGTARERITLLHCTSSYPCPLEDVNLRAMQTMREKFGCRIGYSDHTQGITVPIAAVALGATVIEKHFTLDRTMLGPDHSSSLEPGELAQMVTGIREVEMAMGTPEKRMTESEKNISLVARKRIVALRPIKKGQLFTADNLTVKRANSGLSANQWDLVVGQTSAMDYEEDDPINLT